MLKFIGIGSAFNTKLGNTSAFIQEKDSFILIDCGGTIFHRLQELKLLDGIKRLYVVITHMHPDHVGSLGEVIFYNHYILKNKLTLIYPDRAHMETFLHSIGVTAEMYDFISQAKVKFEDACFGEVCIDYVPVTHVAAIEAYGFIIKVNRKRIYYSGDTNQIDSQIIDQLKNKELDVIYQDTSGLDYKGNNHLSFSKLQRLIDKPYRNRVYCMHLDEHLDQEKVLKEGFNLVRIV